MALDNHCVFDEALCRRSDDPDVAKDEVLNTVLWLRRGALPALGPELLRRDPSFIKHDAVLRLVMRQRQARPRALPHSPLSRAPPHTLAGAASVQNPCPTRFVCDDWVLNGC